MKQEVVAKINKFGKIGEVIAQISRIFVILGAVILLAAGGSRHRPALHLPSRRRCRQR